MTEATGGAHTAEATDAGWRTRVAWLVRHPQRPEVLATGTPEHPRLPETELDGEVWMGDTEVLAAALLDQAELDVIVLSCTEQHADRATKVQDLRLVAILRPGTEPPGTVRWVEAADLSGADRRPNSTRPWASPGWFAEADRWLRSSIEPQYAITGPVRQVRLWDLSCVLRAPTSRGDVYLKAAVESPLFANEPMVLATLAELFPGLIPAPLAVDGERRWLALADLGPALETEETGWCVPIKVREAVMVSVAAMHRDAVAHVGALRAAGCIDRGLDRLAAEATTWLPELDAGVVPTGCDPASWLSPVEVAELTAVVPRLVESCAELAGYAVPVTLVHGDLGLSNVATRAGGYVIFDWTDACIAHPFVDLLDIHYEKDAEIRVRLRDIYLRQWADLEPPERLLRAWDLAEPLAALHHAISYRSLAAGMHPPLDQHMATSTAYWLRTLIAGLGRGDGGVVR